MTNTLTIDLADVLERKFPHGFHAPADIDISTFLEFADDDWSFDLDEFLTEQQLIAVIWNIRLVLDERPDLTDDQAWKVLQACQPEFEEVTDAIRQTVRQASDEIFPRPKGKAALKALFACFERQLDALPTNEMEDPAGYGRVAALLDSLESLAKGA